MLLRLIGVSSFGKKELGEVKYLLGELYHLIELGWLAVAWFGWHVITAVMKDNQVQFGEASGFGLLTLTLLLLNRVFLRRFRLR
ncbi:MAG: hypothetical protein E6P95_01235 [Candidatus Moraniibacteriota bacterium]|nr:MAG: hypothetical protein E6P95_01235 [Candidatus Moranbacteria bacterium]